MKQPVSIFISDPAVPNGPIQIFRVSNYKVAALK